MISNIFVDRETSFKTEDGIGQHHIAIWVLGGYIKIYKLQVSLSLIVLKIP